MRIMPDNEMVGIGKDYGIGIALPQESFHVKGMDHCDWGMKKRLSNIFDSKDGRTVMLAFDHGYMMGSTRGLERVDLTIPPLIDHVDVLMATRGALRSMIMPKHQKGVALRCSAGSSVLKDDMSLEVIGVDIEDAIRMDADCMAVQTFIGSENECQSLNNLITAINTGNRYGIPVLGIVAVGKQMERTPKFFLLATRMLAELGAQIVKTYYCKDFEKITAACPVPIVIAGGKKLAEKEALQMTYQAIQEGAKGVDMGRNVFQSTSPEGMAMAVKGIVHGEMNVNEAYELFQEVRNEKSK